MGSGDGRARLSRRFRETAEAARRRRLLRRSALCAAGCAIVVLLGLAGWYGLGETVPEPGVEHGASAAPEPALPSKAAPEGPKAEPLAWIDDLDAVQIGPELGPARQVRLLVPSRTEGPLLCSIEEPAAEQAVGSASCKPLGARLPKDAAGYRLARYEQGGPELVYARLSSGKDGFFEASSGQRIWRPGYAEAQAVTLERGSVRVLYAVARKDRSKVRRRAAEQAPTSEGAELRSRPARLDHLQLVRLEPGRAPSNHWLDLPPSATTLLGAQALLWWGAEPDPGRLRARAIPASDEGSLGPEQAIGQVPPSSQAMAELGCGAGHAVLLRSGSHPAEHTLLLLRESEIAAPVALGAWDGSGALGCAGAKVAVVALAPGGALGQWLCGPSGCESLGTGQLTGPALGSRILAAAPLGDKVLTVWVEHQGGLHARVAAVAAFEQAKDVTLLGADALGDPEQASVRLVSGDDAAVVLVRSAAGELRASWVRANAALAVKRTPEPRRAGR